MIKKYYKKKMIFSYFLKSYLQEIRALINENKSQSQTILIEKLSCLIREWWYFFNFCPFSNCFVSTRSISISISIGGFLAELKKLEARLGNKKSFRSWELKIKKLLHLVLMGAFPLLATHGKERKQQPKPPLETNRGLLKERVLLTKAPIRTPSGRMVRNPFFFSKLEWSQVLHVSFPVLIFFSFLPVRPVLLAILLFFLNKKKGRKWVPNSFYLKSSLGKGVNTRVILAVSSEKKRHLTFLARSIPSFLSVFKKGSRPYSFFSLAAPGTKKNVRPSFPPSSCSYAREVGAIFKKDRKELCLPPMVRDYFVRSKEDSSFKEALTLLNRSIIFTREESRGNGPFSISEGDGNLSCYPYLLSVGSKAGPLDFIPFSSEGGSSKSPFGFFFLFLRSKKKGRGDDKNLLAPHPLLVAKEAQEGIKEKVIGPHLTKKGALSFPFYPPLVDNSFLSPLYAVRVASSPMLMGASSMLPSDSKKGNSKKGFPFYPPLVDNSFLSPSCCPTPKGLPPLARKKQHRWNEGEGQQEKRWNEGELASRGNKKPTHSFLGYLNVKRFHTSGIRRSDSIILKLLWKWAYKRHSKKSNKWLIKQYFPKINGFRQSRVFASKELVQLTKNKKKILTRCQPPFPPSCYAREVASIISFGLPLDQDRGYPFLSYLMGLLPLPCVARRGKGSNSKGDLLLPPSCYAREKGMIHSSISKASCPSVPSEGEQGAYKAAIPLPLRGRACGRRAGGCSPSPLGMEKEAALPLPCFLRTARRGRACRRRAALPLWGRGGTKASCPKEGELVPLLAVRRKHGRGDNRDNFPLDLRRKYPKGIDLAGLPTERKHDMVKKGLLFLRKIKTGLILRRDDDEVITTVIKEKVKPSFQYFINPKPLLLNNTPIKITKKPMSYPFFFEQKRSRGYLPPDLVKDMNKTAFLIKKRGPFFLSEKPSFLRSLQFNLFFTVPTSREISITQEKKKKKKYSPKKICDQTNDLLYCSYRKYKTRSIPLNDRFSSLSLSSYQPPPSPTS